MKEIKHYICDICDTEYKDKNSCQRCKKSHIKRLEIVRARYVSINNNAKGYPMSVEIKMPNGEIIRYKK